MGVFTESKLLIGCYYDELSEFFDKKIAEGETESHYALEDNSEVIECYFDYMSPYYDSPPSSWFLGFEIPNGDVFDKSWVEIVSQKAKEFEELTGVIPVIYGGAHVY